MVLFLYSDKNCEYQAISCIKSFKDKITDDVTILYYTVGFESDFKCKNLRKVRIGYKDYPSFHYYKAELSLLTLKLYPEEKYFIFSDTDILYSRRFDFSKLKHDLPYPLASFGPHEVPFTYEIIDNNTIIYNEQKAMDYFNVPHRTMRYVWSCFYTFNHNCLDFLEEYTSMCQNRYLLDKRKWFFPFHDETSFNVCLWKRNATENLGHAFVNTHSFELVKKVEENNSISDEYTGKNIDKLGADWEYVHDSAKVICYHGFKEKEGIDKTLKYLINE